MQIESNRGRRSLSTLVALGLLMFVMGTFVAASARANLTTIDDTGTCTAHDQKVLQRQTDLGRPIIGDRDFDGISNCTEKKVIGTDHRDPDSDDDGVEDGQELKDGTDPLDLDSDDDGLDDGDEDSVGSDPLDDDSDDDGELDGDDLDPADDLDEEIEGNVASLICPVGGGDGSLTLAMGSGITVVLTAATEFDGVESCDHLAALMGTPNPSDCDDGGDVHVEIELLSDPSQLIAHEVDLEDSDCDGSPDMVDDDDDNDGIDDDEDDDDDGDGIDDDEDDDDEDDD
jgi:heat shock protein beta